jgi:replication factor C subunit 2/4
MLSSLDFEKPFIEKYRPTSLSELVGNTYAITQLQCLAQSGNFPHLILVGPPGTGKTSSIYCLASHLIPPPLLKSAVLELNASDDRGIDVVRDKIK